MQIVYSFAAAVVGWLVLEFVGRPFRGFFDLRSEVIRLLTEFANVRARWKPVPDDSGSISGDMEEKDLSYEEIERLDEATNEIRAVAARMRAFALNETCALYATRALGYEPFKASEGLIGLSNSFAFYGEQKNFHRIEIAKALKFNDQI